MITIDMDKMDEKVKILIQIQLPPLHCHNLPGMREEKKNETFINKLINNRREKIYRIMLQSVEVGTVTVFTIVMALTKP